MFRALLCPSSGARDYIVLLSPMVCDTLVADGRGQVQDSRLLVGDEGCCSTESSNICSDARTNTHQD